MIVDVAVAVAVGGGGGGGASLKSDDYLALIQLVK
jgi:hypothetical protein